MHDIRAIRDDPEGFDRALARRGIAGPSREEIDAVISPDHQRAAADGLAEGRVTFDTYGAFVLTLDETRRFQIQRAEEGQQRIKELSREAGAAKRSGDEGRFSELQRRSSETKDGVAADQRLASDYDEKLRTVLLGIPNLPDDDVPDGGDETANVEIRRWGEPRAFDHPPREHFDLPAARGLDFETAAKLSGSRFVVLRGAMARLHRALAQFMLDTHTGENGLAEVSTPVLVREEAMLGTGQLPKFDGESFRTADGLWLIPTAEVTLTNTVAGAILDERELPIRMTAHTLCFRSEAGSAGRDTRGMLRQHQFEKVEMVSIVRPEESRAELERMTRCAEGILERLGLPYRTVVLCTGDMGFGARRTHDIEVWLPGQGTYREISSVSDTGAFQARRMNARYRPEGGGKPEFVHTLNGSGLAVGRCLIAVLENGQGEDGSVELPEALGPWIAGARQITPEGELA